MHGACMGHLNMHSFIYTYVIYNCDRIIIIIYAACMHMYGCRAQIACMICLYSCIAGMLCPILWQSQNGRR